ncbi:MAG: DNA primase DnaG [Candidatus Micrarchaeota archaeon]
MAKSYVDTVKYLIKSSYKIDGIVEKPDIVGAVFGQTEGLLGDELDLRELQKNGRIGRIEVSLEVKGGKSFGNIIVPSSLDMVETSILGASLEVVDRVGPCDAEIRVSRIEDSRSLKRKQLLDRAKSLLKTLISEEMPESKELSELVREDVKIAEVINYGPDNLPAGPAIDSSDNIIVVEGRADVINLLRNDIKNVVAVGGAKVNDTIIKLCREKETTVFLDGDRGGDIILAELTAATDIDFVARAPTGKEVEELTRKEIIKSLRGKVPLDQVNSSGSRGDYPDRAPRREFRREARRPSFAPPQPAPQPVLQREEPKPPVDEGVAPEDKETVGTLKTVLKELEGSLRARLLDDKFNTVKEVPIREIMKTVEASESVHAIVLDGIVTQRLIDSAEQKGAAFIVGIRAGNVSRKPEKTKVILSA